MKDATKFNFLLCALVGCSLFGAKGASAQSGLEVEYFGNTEELTQAVGGWLAVEPENLTWSGDLDQFATFQSNQSGIGIASGFMMATGSCENAVGPNDLGGSTTGGGNFGIGDVDLTALSTFNMNDAAILEFDFVANRANLDLDFVFGSDEYNEFVCGSVNDAFGLFLSGPGISGPFTNGAVNCALLPGTDVPVSINTVNLGTVGINGSAANCLQTDSTWDQHAAYFIDNSSDTTAWTTQFDGYTVVITASHPLVVDSTYHLKLAIADAGDTAFDSGMFMYSTIVATGCTYSLASNYEPFAIQDDGSCIFKGCTDEAAVNFNSLANDEDGSCSYYCNGEDNPCQSDATGDGQVSIADLLILLGEFGTCGE